VVHELLELGRSGGCCCARHGYLNFWSEGWGYNERSEWRLEADAWGLGNAAVNEATKLLTKSSYVIEKHSPPGIEIDIALVRRSLLSRIIKTSEISC
jgi:hypothetical protein